MVNRRRYLPGGNLKFWDLTFEEGDIKLFNFQNSDSSDLFSTRFASNRGGT